jgi:hypothetical protein
VTLEGYRAWSDQAERLEKEIMATYEPSGSLAPLRLSSDVLAAFWWQIADQRRCTVPPRFIPDSRAARAALTGRQFHSLRNPFEPLLAIWRLGYAFSHITAHDVVLVVPKIE